VAVVMVGFRHICPQQEVQELMVCLTLVVAVVAVPALHLALVVLEL
jgi:hypothetical protein